MKAWAVALLLAFAAHLDVTPNTVLDTSEASVSAVEAPSEPSKPNGPESTQGVTALVVAQMIRLTIAAQRAEVLPLAPAPGLGPKNGHERRVERPPTASLLT